jgi:putative flippase GtrA
MPKQELILKLLRFGLVGVTVTLTFVGLTHVFAAMWGKQLGFLAAYPFAVGLHFALNKWFTFGNKTRAKSRQVGEYLLMVLVTFAIQWVVYTAIVTWTQYSADIAALVANGTQMLVSFIMMDRRVFAPEKTSA